MHRYTITGPEVAHRVTTPEALVLKHRAHMKSMGMEPRGHQGPPPMVYVSEGRALFDCECGNGPHVSREWGLAVCFACGLVYTRFLFPVGWSDIDMLMSVRPRRRQNVARGESLAQLSEENRANRLPHQPEAIRQARKLAADSVTRGLGAGEAHMRVGGKAERGL